MAELHEALACLRPKEYSEVPTDNLKTYLAEVLAKAELIANSVPPAPNGTPYESSKRTRTNPQPATNAADLTISDVRRPPPDIAHEELQKSWGKPVKLGAKEAATGMSVFKMAGSDRHGAWFSRTGVHEGLGFAKWKRAMLREFPESLEVQGGPGEGNIRGIGGDRRLEDITVDGVGQLQVYLLSAQFPGPTSPREFITLLITSDTCLTDASKVGDTIPRHFMVVSIPVNHPDAPPRNGMVRGFYESIEMIREIPLADAQDPETNPVEWIMVTRSDPGGGIPRFMVERNVPSSIVQDAVKFLDWACAKPHSEDSGSKTEEGALAVEHDDDQNRRPSFAESNGIAAGVGASIVDRPSNNIRRASHRDTTESSAASEGIMGQIHSIEAYVPDALNPMQRTISSSSSISSASSSDSFASAEDFGTTREGLPANDSVATSQGAIDDSPHGREMQKIEDKKRQLKEKLDQAQEKQNQDLANESNKTQKEMEKAAEKHTKERKKQEDKFEREIRKLEERREKETKKLLARQQKEADKNGLLKALRERDEYKQRLDIVEEENKLLKEQIGGLQRENTALVARLGKTEFGRDVLKAVQEEDGTGRARASSRASRSSGKSGKLSESSIASIARASTEKLKG